MKKKVVSLWKAMDFKSYPSESPYNPSISYPEYTGDIALEPNVVYDAFRNVMHQMKLDDDNFDSSRWNPLGYLIKPGNMVVIKPNFVLHFNEGNGTIESVITNISLIRAVVDYVYIALQGEGQIIIGDASQANCDYEKILEMVKIDDIVQYYKEKYDFNIEIDDFRQMKYEYHNGVLDETSRTMINGDPRGYTVFDLGNQSFINDIANPERIYGADYDRKEVVIHHSNGKNEYCVASTIMKADVVICMPKMKTHKKSGVTLNLKNLVGINGNKNFLPHFRIGDPSQGGDEYGVLDKTEKIRKGASRRLIDNLLVDPNLFKSLIYKSIRNLYLFFRPILVKEKEENIYNQGGGCWYGNDTIWRMILDLNMILWHGKDNGAIDPHYSRKIFCIVDGFIAGEGEGPMAPDDKSMGVVVIGENPLAVDIACIKAMGFDYEKIPLYKEAIKNGLFDISNYETDVQIVSNYENNLKERFAEPKGWKGTMI